MGQDMVPAREGELALPETRDGIELRTLCGAGLWKLLAESDDRDGAIRLISINKTLRARLQDLYPDIERRTRVATTEQIGEFVAELFVQFRVNEEDKSRVAVMVRPYLDALERTQVEALEIARTRWNRAELYPAQPGRHAFMPQPAELVALAAPSQEALTKARNRARLALEHVETAEKPKTTPEEAAEMRAALKGLAQQISGGAVAPGPARVGRTPQQVAEDLRRAADTPFDGEAL